jgi:hypothetical protein
MSVPFLILYRIIPGFFFFLSPSQILEPKSGSSANTEGSNFEIFPEFNPLSPPLLLVSRAWISAFAILFAYLPLYNPVSTQ